MLYLWIKALHIISLIAWYAGIFYIWRLFVYHAMTESEETKETLMVMERKLLRFIMGPAAVATTVFGLWMLILMWDAYSRTYWIWLKLFLVILVFIQHGLAEHYRRRLEKGEKFNHKLFRYLNEFPTLLLIFIVILVVVRPFGSF